MWTHNLIKTCLSLYTTIIERTANKNSQRDDLPKHNIKNLEGSRHSKDIKRILQCSTQNILVNFNDEPRLANLEAQLRILETL